MNPVRLIKPKRFGDERGWFSETYNEATFAAQGVTARFVQHNQSLSRPAFTLRGLHFQVPPTGQDKLVHCVAGRIFDVAVDVRRGSPTFGHWVGAELSAENGHELFVPIGFAHGCLTLEPDTQVCYNVSSLYSPADEAGIRWDDAGLGIDWPIPDGATPLLSPKDRDLPALQEFDSPFAYDGNPLEPLGD